MRPNGDPEAWQNGNFAHTFPAGRYRSCWYNVGDGRGSFAPSASTANGYGSTLSAASSWRKFPRAPTPATMPRPRSKWTCSARSQGRSEHKPIWMATAGRKFPIRITGRKQNCFAPAGQISEVRNYPQTSEPIAAQTPLSQWHCRRRCRSSGRRRRSAHSGRMFRARIGANESSFGPSPRVIAAMDEAAPGMWKYCDPDNHDLKAAACRPSWRRHRQRRGRRRHRRAAQPRGAHVCGARRCGGHLARRLSDLQLPRRRLRRAAGRGALRERPRKPRRPARRPCNARKRRWSISPIPTTRWARWWEAAEITRFIERCRKPRCWCSTRPMARPGRPRRCRRSTLPRPNVIPHAHIFEGLRAGRHPLRLCGRRGRGDPRLREGPQPLRRQPHGADRRRRRRLPTRTICRQSRGAGRGRARAHRRRSPAPTG